LVIAGSRRVASRCGSQRSGSSKGEPCPGWAPSEGAIDRDPIGFLLLKGTGGNHVGLRFGASWTVWLGRAITFATILLLLFRAPLWAAAAVALAPSILVYLILQLHTPATVGVAEQAYRRLQPPLISPSAILDGVSWAQPPLTRGSVITVFGSNFGSPSDPMRVRIGEHPAEILYRGATQLNVRMPLDAPPVADVSVEVNGCRGNSFSVATR
jgi:hypothetical protein